MALHKNLAEADLHELKGASTATSGQVPVSNGSGTTVFSKISSSSIDTSSIKNTNVYTVSINLEAITGVFNRYFPVPRGCTLTKYALSCSSLPSANTQLNVQTGAGLSMGSISLATTDTVPTYYDTTSILNSSVTAGSVLRINHPNAGTTVGPVSIVLEFLLT